MDNEKLKALFDSLTDEQRNKAAACKSKEELFALLGELGVELSDELMDKIAGGGAYLGYSVQKPPVIL